MSEIKFGLVAENNLSDLENKQVAAQNLGLNVSALSILNGLSAAGVTTNDFKNLIGSTSNLQSQIDILETELSKKLALSGGTVNSALTVNGVVTANLFLSPAGTPISTSTDSFWSASAGEISYGGNVRINGTLSVNSLSVNPVELIDLTDPVYSFLTYNRAIGLGQYKIPVAIGPSLQLEFFRASLLNQVNGSSPVTFTRASTATYTDSDGIIKSAAINTPAYEHDPLTGICLGLQVEGQFTNLNVNSTPTAGWSVSGATLVNGQGTGPTGTNTFVKLQENSANTTHSAFRDITTVVGSDYTFSGFFKSAGRTVVCLGLNAIGVSFDLTTRQISRPFGSGVNILSYNFRSYGNGITRCWITIRAQSTTTRFSIFTIGPSDASSYLGNGVDGILMDGLQVVLGHEPCSLIPTSGSTVTKSADVVSLTGAFPWIQSGLGSLCAEVVCPDSQIGNVDPQTVFSLNDGSNNNKINIVRAAFNGFATGSVITGGVTQASLEAGAMPRTTQVLTGISWQTNNINLASSTDPDTYIDTSATIPTINRLDIGHDLGANHLNGVVRRIFYVPTGTAEVVNAMKPANTWGNRMVSSYEKINRHAPISPVARQRLLDRMQPGSYFESTFGPSGLNRTACDFLIVFTGSKVCTSIVLSSAATRWDTDGAITTGTSLTSATLTDGVIIASNVNGVSIWTSMIIVNNNLYGALPMPQLTGLTQLNLNLGGAFAGRVQNLTAMPINTLRLIGGCFSGAGILSGLNNLDAIINQANFTSIAGSSLYAIGQYTQSLTLYSNLSQTDVNTIIGQLHAVRTQAASFLPSIALDLRFNAAPGSTALTQITDIRNAFIAASKTHNIQHT